MYYTKDPSDERYICDQCFEANPVNWEMRRGKWWQKDPWRWSHWEGNTKCTDCGELCKTKRGTGIPVCGQAVKKATAADARGCCSALHCRRNGRCNGFNASRSKTQSRPGCKQNLSGRSRNKDSWEYLVRRVRSARVDLRDS